jgi:hypothetical protein
MFYFEPIGLLMHIQEDAIIKTIQNLEAKVEALEEEKVRWVKFIQE